MWEFLRHHRNLVAFSTFLLVGLVLTVIERTDPPRHTGPFTTSSMQAAGASQAALTASIRGLAQRWRDHTELVGVKKENEKLRKELDQVREERTRLLSVMQENARLRAMIGYKDAHPRYQLELARVIARDVNEFFRVVQISIDARNFMIQPDMPVVNSAGLVGKVTSVDGRYAQVLLTVDKRSSIDIVVQRNRARGVLTGSGEPRNYNCHVGYLLRRDEVRVGDVLVTSGMDGVFPPDLVVGTITEVVTRTYGLYQDVKVEPAVDFQQLEEVFVITGEKED